MKFDKPDEYEKVTPEEEKKETVQETVTYNTWYDWYYDQGEVHVEYLYPKKKFDFIQTSCFEEI